MPSEEVNASWGEALGKLAPIKVEDVGIAGFFTVLGVSLLCALFISYLYQKFYRNRSTGSQAHRAFPLLGVSVTAIFICIQFSLPLSLGLLGALSIVRFRTPIKEPEEIGFIMLVIASSLCCATFNLVFLGVILTVAVIGLGLSEWIRGRSTNKVEGGLLTITLALEEYQETGRVLMEMLQETLPQGELEGVQEGDALATISYKFPPEHSEVFFKVQSQARHIAHSSRSSLFLHHAGAL